MHTFSWTDQIVLITIIKHNGSRNDNDLAHNEQYYSSSDFVNCRIFLNETRKVLYISININISILIHLMNIKYKQIESHVVHKYPWIETGIYY